MTSLSGGIYLIKLFICPSRPNWRSFPLDEHRGQDREDNHDANHKPPAATETDAGEHVREPERTFLNKYVSRYPCALSKLGYD